MSTSVEPGLRERKKARTRRAIVRAALELSLERGFAVATLQQIAARADVAPRTVSLYFPHKEDIVFFESTAPLDRLAEHLAAGGDGDLVDRLSEWLIAEADRLDDEGELEHLRQRAISTDPELRMRERLLLETVEAKIAAAAAAELGERPSDVGPRAFATATLGILMSVRDQFASSPHGSGFDEDLDRGLAFLRGGLSALRT